MAVAGVYRHRRRSLPNHDVCLAHAVGAGVESQRKLRADQAIAAGVDAFADSSVVIKLRIKTVPLKQWEVGRELRRRILKAFRENEIEIPFPQRVVRHVDERRDPVGSLDVAD